MIPLRLLAAAALAVAVAGGLYSTGYSLGSSRAQEEAREARETADRTAREKLSRLNVEQEEREKVHEQIVSDLRAGFAAQRAAAQVAAVRDRSAYLDGSERLRFAVRSCAADRTEAAAALSASSGADGETRAELAPETSAALLDIANDGDAAIRQLTALQEWATEATNLCNRNSPATKNGG